MYIMWVTVVMFSICFHEYSHAYAALLQGDSTAAERGHLTMNPMVQMGTFSIIMLLFIGISWGSVPVNRRKFRHKYSDALVSFAGPAANVLLFLVFCLMFTLSRNHIEIITFQQMFFVGAALNAFLFIFNMLPIPMLDGWNVFRFLFPKLNRVSDEIKNALTFIIIILFFMTPLINHFFIISQTLSRIVINFFDILI